MTRRRSVPQRGTVFRIGETTYTMTVAACQVLFFKLFSRTIVSTSGATTAGRGTRSNLQESATAKINGTYSPVIS